MPQPGVAPAPTTAAPSIAQRRDAAYDEMRRRAQQQAVAQQQQQGEALKRRFAAIGNLNSGAYIKAANQQEQAGAATAQNALKDIDFQKANEDYQRELADRQYGLQEQQLGLSKEDLEESKKANAINALIGLGNADLSGLGTDANKINELLKAYGISTADLPKRPAPQVAYNQFGQPYFVGV